MWAPVIKSVATGPTTLQIHLKHPYANLPNVVATGYSRIVNMAVRSKLGATDYGKKVIDGSGPFKFVDWVPGDHVSVKRWDAYPGSITPFFKNKGKAYLDGINWRYIQEAASRAVTPKAPASRSMSWIVRWVVCPLANSRLAAVEASARNRFTNSGLDNGPNSSIFTATMRPRLTCRAL